MSLFPEPNWSFIEPHLLKKAVSKRTYKKGLELQEKAVAEELMPQHARFVIEEQFHSFLVELKLTVYGGFLSRCTCAKSRRGHTCEHVIASVLQAKKLLEQEIAEANQPGRWRLRWNSWVEPLLTQPNEEIILLYSLQFSSSKHYYREDAWKLKVLFIPAQAFYAHGLSSEELLDADIVDKAIEEYDLMARLKNLPNRKTLSRYKPLTATQAYEALLNLKFGHAVPEYIRSYYETETLGLELEILQQDPGALLYLGDPSNPLRRRLEIAPRPLTPQLHLETTAQQGLIVTTHFSPMLESGSKAIDELQVITLQPTWLLYHERYLVQLPSTLPLETFQSLLQNPSFSILPADREDFLNETLPVLAQTFTISGIDIQWETYSAGTFTPRLFLNEEDGILYAALRFGYGDYEVPYDKTLPPYSIVRKQDTFTLIKIERQSEAEQETFRSLSKFGLKRSTTWGIFELRKRVEPVDFLIRYVPRLTAAGFEIYGEESLKSVRVNRNRPTISFNVSSGIDWFDVQAVVRFGDIEASIKEIRRAIRHKERFIKLADGSIGEIPEEWIKRYRRLFALAEHGENDELRFDAHHLTLLDQLLAESDSIQSDEEFKKRLQRLRDFSTIVEQPLPKNFVGKLRPYQEAGYNWLHFLHDYEFGGCLADDMGLGKTIQALAFFQSLRENNHTTKATLIVVPRSLLINWEREANRFTPTLRVLIHAGTNRSQDPAVFDRYDLVITTYGVVLRDLEMLRGYHFHYVVLDESQAIKNPIAKTSRAVRMLQSDHRLALTGTPIENTTLELWSLFAFLNPGLLGTLDFFREDFANPIERRKDEETANILRRTVYPFILRRTKQQVAPELPPRTERIIYCDMEPAQRKLYQRWRDYYRGVVLGLIEEEGGRQVHMKILEGLLRLRQIAILPTLVDEKFRGKSSKFEMLLETLNTLQQENHKALVFSQFVQVLKALRYNLDQQKVPYIYLDGRTRKRQERVDQFQNDPNIPFFLISLKAGGVGLNLTAADYVIHIDPWWNPAVEMQAADRAHRIGQDKPVFIYKLITRDTVEEKILKLQEQKRHLVEQVISTEGGFYKSLSSEDIQVLFS